MSLLGVGFVLPVEVLLLRVVFLVGMVFVLLRVGVLLLVFPMVLLMMDLSLLLLGAHPALFMPQL